MSDNSSSDIGAFLSGFVIGGLVGAAAALILAPQSGEETRTFIRDRGIELRDRAVEGAETARARAEELQTKSKTLMDEQRGKLDAAIESGRKVFQPKQGEVTPKPAAPATPAA